MVARERAGMLVSEQRGPAERPVGEHTHLAIT